MPDPENSGSEILTRDMAYRHRVLVVAPTPPPYSGPEMVTVALIDGLRNNGFVVEHLNSTIRIRNSDKGKLTAAAVASLLRLTVHLWGKLSTGQYSAVYTILSQNNMGFGRDAVVIFSAAIWRRPIVAHLHGGNFHTFVEYSTWWMRRIISLTMPRITRLILLGDRVRRTVSRAIPDNRVRVVHNGINADQLVNGKSFDSLWQERRHASEGIRVVHLGLLSNAKGIGDVLAAIPAVLAAGPTTQFVFAGEIIASERNITRDEQGHIIESGNLHERIDAVLRAHSANVSYRGVVRGQEKGELLTQADVFIMPSYSEGMPFALLEAMAFGLPIVSTAVGAIPDILRDPEHAAFVPVGEASVLADRVLALIRDARARRVMGQANYGYVRRSLSQNQMVKDIADVIEEAITGGPPREH